jgi:hypothetical protein
MTSYPKPFWQHPENIERERRYFIGKLESQELSLAGPARTRLIRLLNRLQPNPDQPEPV